MTNPFFIRSASITGRDEYYAWGLHQVAKAVSFLNNDCKLVSIFYFDISHWDPNCVSILIMWSDHLFLLTFELALPQPASLVPFQVSTV